MQETYRDIVEAVRAGQEDGFLPKGDEVVVMHLRGAVMAFEHILVCLGLDSSLADEALDAVLEETGVKWTE